MTAVSPLQVGVLLQAEPEIDPDIVRPGLLPLLIVVLLLGALVFLFFSMQKQMRKIRTPDDIEAERLAAGEAEGQASAGNSGAPARPEEHAAPRTEVRSELGPDVRAEPHPRERADAPDTRPDPREPRP